jgi:aspartate/tyrosine/aromatic aminotransferase
MAKIVRRTVGLGTPLLAAEAAGLALERTEYYEELENMRLKLEKKRHDFARIIGNDAPNVANGKGLFTKLLPAGFSDQQLDFLHAKGILALPNSRVNLGGLRTDQVERVATLMHQAL